MNRRARDAFSTEPAPGRGGRPALSVVVPLFEEGPLVGVLVDRLARALDGLGLDFEVVLVDDGSTDGTLAAVARAHASDPRFVGVSLSRNFGHQAAISAGLAHARGSAVVVMDGDLQDPPEAIGPLYEKLREGHDVVYAVRASRPEGALKRLAYHAYYRLLRRLGSVEVPVDAGDFGIMSRRVVDAINALPERRRFVRGLRAWVGFRQTGLAVHREARHSGRPKFTAGKLVGLAVDGLVGFSDAPLRWAGGCGLGALLLAGAGLVALPLGWLAGGGRPPAWAFVGLLVGFSAGVQLLFLAVLGEYVARILQEVHGRPAYLVRQRVGVAAPAGRSRRRGHAAGSRGAVTGPSPATYP